MEAAELPLVDAGAAVQTSSPALSREGSDPMIDLGGDHDMEEGGFDLLEFLNPSNLDGAPDVSAVPIDGSSNGRASRGTNVRAQHRQKDVPAEDNDESTAHSAGGVDERSGHGNDDDEIEVLEDESAPSQHPSRAAGPRSVPPSPHYGSYQSYQGATAAARYYARRMPNAEAAYRWNAAAAHQHMRGPHYNYGMPGPRMDRAPYARYQQHHSTPASAISQHPGMPRYPSAPSRSGVYDARTAKSIKNFGQNFYQNAGTSTSASRMEENQRDEIADEIAEIDDATAAAEAAEASKMPPSALHYNERHRRQPSVYENGHGKMKTVIGSQTKNPENDVYFLPKDGDKSSSRTDYPMVTPDSNSFEASSHEVVSVDTQFSRGTGPLVPPSGSHGPSFGTLAPAMAPPINYSMVTPENSASNGAVEDIPYLPEPSYFEPSPGFTATWSNLLPPQTNVLIPAVTASAAGSFPKSYKLSLLSVTEFTIAAFGDGYVGQSPHSSSGVPELRAAIRKIAREAGGTAKYEEVVDDFDDDDDEMGGAGGHADQAAGMKRKVGRWRIPLGAYHALVTHLSTMPNVVLTTIPEHELRIASMGRAQLEKGFPAPEALIERGLPAHLAHKLAPYQRGGVEFILEREGRGLIADDMGLGKTLQSIASMACYEKEWPLLVLSPSSARYHWKHEILMWLGHSNADATELYNGDSHGKKPMKLLKENEINVMGASKDLFLPHKNTRVVICSYGLAPALANRKRLLPGEFKCVIVDESHLLKNKDAKRTKFLMPVLLAARRCIMLSGTPAFARPAELWPQLHVLGRTEGWWQDEQEFIQKYARSRTSKKRRKKRSQEEDRASINCMAELHTLLTSTVMIRRMKSDMLKALPPKVRECARLVVRDRDAAKEISCLIEQLKRGKGILKRFASKCARTSGDNNDSAPSDNGGGSVVQSKPSRDRGGEGEDFDEGETEREPTRRKLVLGKLFRLTGVVKVPTIAKMLRDFLADSTSGKVCVFAHHLDILDRVTEEAGLDYNSNVFIRIDGATKAKVRQDRIQAFQNDPTVRVALLGITAAGVAVTLTASSNVWFAELFWTPAVMIQAEDRCHRIGQQARVKCLYFMAKDTLDEVLWKLIEAKLRDLGEFVEGKENSNLVVHRVVDEDEDGTLRVLDDGKGGLKDDGTEDESFSPANITDDIEVMRQEELALIRTLEDSDDEDGDKAKRKATSPAHSSTPPPVLSSAENDASNVSTGYQSVPTLKSPGEEPLPVPSNSQKSTSVVESSGACQEAAILLDDESSEEEDCVVEVTRPGEEQNVLAAVKNDIAFMSDIETPFHPRMQLPYMKFLKIFFVVRRKKDNYGLHIVPYKGRMVVSKRDETMLSHGKPASGALLIAINGTILPLGIHYQDVATLLTRAKGDSPIQLTFGEDEEFIRFMTETGIEVIRRQRQTRANVGHQPNVVPTGDAAPVIDLLDDDDD